MQLSKEVIKGIEDERQTVEQTNGFMKRRFCVPEKEEERTIIGKNKN